MLELRGVAKSYGDVEAIGDIGFAVAEREFLCVVGPSGGGKTTLLKLISGLLAPTRGEILLRGRRVTEPPPALLPITIILLHSIGDRQKIGFIGFFCLFPVLLNTIDGVRGIDPTLTDTARVYGIRGLDRLRRIVLPAASPQIFAGMRTSLSLAVILMVISEMVASTNGIGFFVLQSQRSFAIPEMWSGILLLGILGYLLNLVFALVEGRALAWHRGGRDGA